MRPKGTSMVICKQSGRYIGWPTVAKAPDGELLAVFSGDRDEHVCPYGKTFLVRSADNGVTWGRPELVNDTPLDDRDAGIVVLRSGTIVVTWFTSLVFERPDCRAHYDKEGRWSDDIAKLTDADRRQWLGHWTRRSTDGGKTWEDPVRNAGTAPHGCIQLEDGRLLYVGNASDGKRTRITIEESRDEGRSWTVIGELPIPDDVHPARLCESHVVETADGKLVAMFRTEIKDGSDRYLRQSESRDGGKTWTVPEKTTIWGYPPHLIRVHDGRLLVTYGYRREPFGERASLSADGGRTWDVENEVVIRDDAPNGDLGYPASVELDDGRILTVYYQIDRPGEKTCLMGTIWELP